VVVILRVRTKLVLLGLTESVVPWTGAEQVGGIILAVFSVPELAPSI
jgi:hypothetical protein